jgi:hypothetical protein
MTVDAFTSVQAAIIKLLSPSAVGDAMACPLQLSLDALNPKQDNKYKEAKAFGTVAHFVAQCLRGVDPIPAKPSAEDYKLARRVRDAPTGAAFEAHVERIAREANRVIDVVSPLPPGVRWTAEKRVYDPTLLPERRNRHGEAGYGGLVDLFSSDGLIAWDYKFTGYLPDEINSSYLWQMISYHVVSGARYAGIVFCDRNTGNCVYAFIDWHHPRLSKAVPYLSRFLRFASYKNFHELAWPVRGTQCKFCAHRESVCPLWATDASNVPLLQLRQCPKSTQQTAAALGVDLDLLSLMGLGEGSSDPVSLPNALTEQSPVALFETASTHSEVPPPSELPPSAPPLSDLPPLPPPPPSKPTELPPGGPLYSLF